MADLPESPDYAEGVYQIETTDPVIGGPNGESNKQAKDLANRTAWLKQQVDQLVADLGSLGIPEVAGLQTSLDSKLPSSSYSANDVLAKLLSVDGVGSGLDADRVRGLAADFSASLGYSGYQRLPSGLIIQWGGVSINSGGDAWVTFPIAFPSLLIAVIPSAVLGPGSTHANDANIMGWDSATSNLGGARLMSFNHTGGIQTGGELFLAIGR